MELEEHGHEYRDYSIEHECQLDRYVTSQQLLVLSLSAVIVGIEGPLDTLEPSERHTDNDPVGNDQYIDKEKDKKLAVPETNTVVNPRAMMVHVEHAPVARRAMMATLRLKYVAHEAVAATFVLRVTQVEAPEDWNLTWVSCHRLDERPYEQDEQDMEHG